MKPLKALIVEDSANDAELLLRQLAKAGYDVQSIRVQTAAEMEKALAEREWDIILSDYAMPSFTGLDALRVLKKSGWDIPLIIISGTIGEDVAVEAMRIGVDDYLMKGSLTRLAPAIERELENAASRKAQKRAEEALRRSEESLASAQRIAHIGSWDWDIPNNTLLWSEESYRIFGVSKNDFGITLESFFNFIHPEDRQSVQAILDAALLQNALYNIEHRIVRPNGEERIVCEIGEVIFNESGKPVQFVGTVQDITERKAAENEMRLMKSAVDSIAEGIVITDPQKPDNPIIYTNAAFENLTGYAFKEIKGQNCRFLQGAGTNPRTVDEIRKAIEQGTTFRGEILNYSKNGEPFWNELVVSPVFDQLGRLTNLVGVQQDISERKRAEGLLLESEEKFRSIVETTSEWIWAFDAQGNCSFSNPALKTILGYAPEEILGKSFLPLMHEEEREKFQQLVPTLIADKQGWTNLVLRWYHKDGGIRYLESNALPLLNSDGEVIGYRGSDRDITDSKRIEEEKRLLTAEIENQHERLNNILVNVPGVVWEAWGEPAAATQRINFISDYVEILLGYTVEEWVSTPNFWLTIVHPEDKERIAREATERFVTGNGYTRQFRWIAKDGRIVWVESQATVIFDEEGQPIGLRGINIDITERKRLEEERIKLTAELNFEKARLQHIFDNSPSFIVSMRGPEFIFEMVNPAYYRLVGDRNLIGLPVREAIPEVMTQGLPEMVNRVYTTGEPFTGNEVPVKLHSRGESAPKQHYINFVYMPLREADNSISGIISYGMDVTEQVESRGRIKESEERYRIIAETISDMIITIDETGLILFVNAAAETVLGYSPEELVGNNLSIIIPERFRQAHEKGMEHYMQTGDKRISWSGIEIQAVSRDGQEKQVEISFGEYHETDKHLLTGVFRDITERKRSEAALREAEDKYRNLVESSPAIVYLREPYPPFAPIYVSPNITRFGYSVEEWFDQSDMLVSIIHEEDRARLLLTIEDALERGGETELEYRVVVSDGTMLWVHDKGRFVFDEWGNKTGWQGVMMDITKTKLLEDQLRQSQKLESVGLLAGGIAHDFNNMLTAINGYSDLTLRKLSADDPLRRNIEEIKKAGERSADLTHQLLAFSRQQILQPIVLNLNETIRDTMKMLDRLIGEDIQLATIFNPKIGLVKVDPGQLSQIIMNLAVNARDAMPRGGKLTIETANVFLDPNYARGHVGVLPGAYVMLAISDTGSGMSAETKEHIFEPFFTTKGIGQGTGLGLATVYGIVKQSGGNIEVYSEESVGTTVKVYLPRVAEQAAIAKFNEASTELAKGTETILLVEDEQSVRELSRQVLEECGYTVIEAKEGIEALKICEQKDYKFDLLMTDVVMPQMGGFELSEILKTKLANLKILFTSGYTDDAIVRHGVIETGTNFIQKPFSPEALADKIRKILDDSD